MRRGASTGGGQREEGGGRREQGRAGAETERSPRAAPDAAGLPGPPVSPGCGSDAALPVESPRFQVHAPARNLAPESCLLVIAPASHFGMCSLGQ